MLERSQMSQKGGQHSTCLRYCCEEHRCRVSKVSKYFLKSYHTNKVSTQTHRQMDTISKSPAEVGRGQKKHILLHHFYIDL